MFEMLEVDALVAAADRKFGGGVQDSGNFSGKAAAGGLFFFALLDSRLIRD